VTHEIRRVEQIGTVVEIIKEEVLSDIDQVPFKIQEIDGIRLTLYYR